MPTISASLPTALDRYLSANHRDDLPSLVAYVDRGAALVTPEAVAGLRKLHTPLWLKIDAIDNSHHLRRRLELLAIYFEEASGDGSIGSAVHREVTFALLYFLKGFDRIPDSVPEIGLLDDAMITQIVIQRNATALRAHWLRHRRAWPAEL